MRENDYAAAAEQQLRDARQKYQDAKQFSYNAHRHADEYASKQINESLQDSFFSFFFNLSVLIHLFTDPPAHKQIFDIVNFTMVFLTLFTPLYCCFIFELFIVLGYECDRHLKRLADSWSRSSTGSVCDQNQNRGGDPMISDKPRLCIMIFVCFCFSGVISLYVSWGQCVRYTLIKTLCVQ